MGLGNLTFPAIEVKTPGGSFPVRGLSFYDLLGVFFRHRESATNIFGLVMDKTQKGEKLDLLDINLLIVEMITIAPRLVAEIVSIGAGADVNAEDFEGEVAVARALPFAVQVDAIEKIASQTFTEEMPAKKAFALVLKAAKQQGAN